MSEESPGTDAGSTGPLPAAPVHLPGDPTPVPAGREGGGCLGAIGRTVRDLVLELVGEVVLGLVLAVLTTASLAGAFVLAVLAHRQSPALAYALGALAVAVVALGIRQLRRPREQRGRAGRILGSVTSVLGVWLMLCVGYASLSEALDLATF
ncbi:hypothetical protein [Kitasatospora sp. NBC_00458]|uniref:hypothetical protein n=1 Tax=Kitasatospora sp. NBC_00458 TaxID=2903568 RepID=UPI002E183C9F